MITRRFLVRMFAVAIALCTVGMPSQSAEAARVDLVAKGTTYANQFKVKAKKEAGGIRVILTVPQSMREYKLASVSYYVDSQTRVSTNGDSLEILIDADSFKKAFVNAGYTDPNHKPGESGGYWSFQLNISSLVGELK